MKFKFFKLFVLVGLLLFSSFINSEECFQSNYIDDRQEILDHVKFDAVRPLYVDEPSLGIMVLDAFAREDYLAMKGGWSGGKFIPHGDWVVAASKSIDPHITVEEIQIMGNAKELFGEEVGINVRDALKKFRSKLKNMPILSSSIGAGLTMKSTAFSPSSDKEFERWVKSVVMPVVNAGGVVIQASSNTQIPLGLNMFTKKLIELAKTINENSAIPGALLIVGQARKDFSQQFSANIPLFVSLSGQANKYFVVVDSTDQCLRVLDHSKSIFEPQSYIFERRTGSSYSAPQVAVLAAHLSAQFPDKSGKEIAMAILEGANDLLVSPGDFGQDIISLIESIKNLKDIPMRFFEKIWSVDQIFGRGFVDLEKTSEILRGEKKELPIALIDENFDLFLQLRYELLYWRLGDQREEIFSKIYEEILNIISSFGDASLEELQESISDTLCGTNAMVEKDYAIDTFRKKVKAYLDERRDSPNRNNNIEQFKFLMTADFCPNQRQRQRR